MHWPPNQIVAILSTIFYGVLSLSMSFLNKAVVSVYGFNYPFFILFCQMTLTLFTLECLRISGKFNLPVITLSSIRMFVVPSFCYSLHASLSLLALEGMNIPMYTAIKRCTPLINLILAVVYLKKPRPSCLLESSVIVITIGCLIAGMTDATFNGFSYFMGALSVLMQGLYLTLVQQCGDNNASPLHILHLNSYISVIPFLMLTLCLDEVTAVTGYKHLTDPDFVMVFILLLVMGLLLNFSLFLCTLSTSALTTSIVGMFKSVLQTAIGFYVFGGIAIHSLNVAGLVINMAGGVMYSYAKYIESKKKQRKIDLGDPGIQQTGWELKAKLQSR